MTAPSSPGSPRPAPVPAGPATAPGSRTSHEPAPVTAPVPLASLPAQRQPKVPAFPKALSDDPARQVALGRVQLLASPTLTPAPPPGASRP